MKSKVIHIMENKFSKFTFWPGLLLINVALINGSTSQTTNKTKQTPWPLVRERTIPTDRPPLVDEI
jgi:hypothetical protein